MKLQRQCALAGTPPTSLRRQRRAPAPACRQQQQQRQQPAGRTNTWNGQLLKPTPLAVDRLTAATPQSPVAEASTEQLGSRQPGGVAATEAASAAPAELSGLQRQWAELPAKYKLVLATSLSFVICNMDKVNISVAIIPMAQEFGWSPTVAGLVQSSFFWGYVLSQIPGGYAASIFGGRNVLPAGVGLWSGATAAVPLLAGTLPGLFLSRASVGLGEGVAPSAATDLVARSIPTDQRSRAISFIFGGLPVGSLLGLLVAPLCIERFGWPSVFYLFGGLGLVWTVWWERLLVGIAEQDPELAASLTGRSKLGDSTPPAAAASASAATAVQQQQQQQQQQQSTAVRLGGAAGAAEDDAHLHSAGHGGHGGVIDANQPVPWRAFLRSSPLRALAYTHFCNNWFHYTMLAWLPTYFTSSLSMDLTHAAQVSLLPPIAAIIVSAIAGPSADALIAGGVPVVTVRKAAQCTAFLGPAGCLLAASTLEGGPASVALVALSLGLASFSLAGLYCNHADLSPRYASVLLGITNTSGALPGIVGVAFTGWLYDQTSSWTWALFMPSIFFFLTGSAAYLIWGRADRQDFESENLNEPFAFEGWWQGASGLLGSGSSAAAGSGSESKSEKSKQE